MIATPIRNSRFKRVQMVDTFDFAHRKAVTAIKPAYLTLYESIAADCLPSAVFTGHAGLGETHLARALGYAASTLPFSNMAAHSLNREWLRLWWDKSNPW